jgi:hypothetical protein
MIYANRRASAWTRRKRQPSAVSRAFASHALLLAQVAEVIAARLKDKPAPEQCRPDEAVTDVAA